MLQRARCTLFQILNVGFQPNKKVIVINDAIFDYLGQPCCVLSIRQSFQYRRVRQHRFGLIKRADHVFACRMIDRGFTPNRRIHLSQQCGRHLNKIHTTLKCRGNKSAKVPHHAATQGDQASAAVVPGLQQKRGDRLVIF